MAWPWQLRWRMGWCSERRNVHRASPAGAGKSKSYGDLKQQTWQFNQQKSGSCRILQYQEKWWLIHPKMVIWKWWINHQQKVGIYPASSGTLIKKWCFIIWMGYSMGYITRIYVRYLYLEGYSSQNSYPLVNIYISMERSTMLKQWIFPWIAWWIFPFHRFLLMFTRGYSFIGKMDDDDDQPWPGDKRWHPVTRWVTWRAVMPRKTCGTRRQTTGSTGINWK